MTNADNTSWIIAAVFVFGLLLAMGVVVKLFDLRRKRESEAVHLQAQVSDALLRDPILFGLPVTPTAHVPFWSGTPVTLEMSGEVPDPSLREAVLRVAASEAQRIRPDVILVDHLRLGTARIAA